MSNLSFGPDFNKFFVGFDDTINRMSKFHNEFAKSIPNYPPYNIKKTGENTYVVELAVAGFGKQDVTVELDGDRLVITGNAANSDAEGDFLYRGIAQRGFTRTFSLNEQVEVQNAEMLNGMLRVFLERIIPEAKKPVKVPVQDKSDTPATKTRESKQFLRD